MHFGFLKHPFQRALHEHFLLGRTTRAIKEDMRQRACPKERRDLRQQLVTDAVLHRDSSLKKRVDTVGEDIRTLTAGGDQTPVYFGTSAICN